MGNCKYVKEFDFPSDKGFTASAGKQMVKGYARGGATKGAAKVGKVMGEFGKGELHSGSKKGPVVKNPKQAVAIALSEARKAGAKIPAAKAKGGSMEASEVVSSKVKASPKSQMSERKMERMRKYEGQVPKRQPLVAAPAPAAAMLPGRQMMKKGGKAQKYAEGGPTEKYDAKGAMADRIALLKQEARDAAEDARIEKMLAIKAKQPVLINPKTGSVMTVGKKKGGMACK